MERLNLTTISVIKSVRFGKGCGGGGGSCGGGSGCNGGGGSGCGGGPK